jgi:hypothetical protein
MVVAFRIIAIGGKMPNFPSTPKPANGSMIFLGTNKIVPTPVRVGCDLSLDRFKPLEKKTGHFTVLK